MTMKSNKRREIKFRCWNVALESYRHGTNVIGYDGKIGHSISSGVIWQSVSAESNYVIEESTGLTDINGKEIYEGDIVKTIWGHCAILFEDGGFAFKGKNNENWLRSEAVIERQMSVVGNIHENHVLLE